MQFETGAAVDKAMDLFWRQGYAGTTPQELASELGIGKGSLYNTFESKHALFMRALRRYSERRLEYRPTCSQRLGRSGRVSRWR
jgi:TetR/AcrR family transcriptional repressor of nem operon